MFWRFLIAVQFFGLISAYLLCIGVPTLCREKKYTCCLCMYDSWNRSMHLLFIVHICCAKGRRLTPSLML